MRNHLKSIIYTVLNDNNKFYQVSGLEIINTENEEISFVAGETNIHAFIKYPEKLASDVHIEIDCSDGYRGLTDDTVIYAKVSDVLTMHNALQRI